MEVLDTGRVVWIYGEGHRPPLKIRNLADRVAKRDPSLNLVFRWLKCGRGCSHGRAYNSITVSLGALLDHKAPRANRRFPDYIRLYFGSSDEDNAIVVLHEAAHHVAGLHHRHDDTFYRALLKEARAEGMLRPVVAFQGGAARRIAREMRAKKPLTTATNTGTFAKTAAGGQTRP